MKSLSVMTLVSLLVWAGVVGCARDRLPHAIIVRQSVYSREGVGASEALSLKDPAAIRQLETFFPGYQAMPGSSFSGAWISGYDIYIDPGNARSVHIVVSYDSAFWTVGNGDLEVAGDFEKFVNQLREKSAR